MDRQTDLISRLKDEADLCRNDGAADIAALLDDAAAEVERLRSRTVTLPPLPKRQVLCRVMPDDYRYGDVYGYTSDQMRKRDEYWIAALRAAGVEVNPPSPSA